jgi:asparagine synthase (glutamine-hydrolysing)
MCGFVVVTRGEGSLAPVSEVSARRDAVAHRGPDEASTEIFDEWVALGHRRLSIIDVAGAHQPLRSEDGQVVCIFNGELYNFATLRSRLKSLGHTFATAGDGEVIVHGYEQWGDDIFAMLEGMFSVALVDRKQRRLVLARDRFGIKPLFYRHDRDGLVAGSELKAVLPSGTPRASRLALSLGAVRLHVPWPLTAFADVYRLPPGALLEVVDRGAPKLSRFAPMCELPERSERPSVEETLEQLRAAVARQMVADVPVGAFLSGGIDSTLIVALMRELARGEIHTFSIQTLGEDEAAVAAETARELGVVHHSIPLAEITFDDLAALPSLYDEPFAETSALGVRALSRFAREHVKVALSGDGGDEIFGGYGSYRWIRAAGRLPLRSRRLGNFAHRLLLRRAWPARARQGLRAAILALDPPASAQRDVSTLSWAADVESRAMSEALSARILAAATTHEAATPAAAAMLADRLERLPNAMLTKVDIASMSASLEVRVPLLDDPLVRFADRIAIGELVGTRFGKLLLRKSLARLPGSRLAWAKKRGFTLPLDRWMRSPAVEGRLGELLGDHAGTLQELTGVRVDETWRTFLTGTSRFSASTAAHELLWLANVALWADRFGIRTSVSSPLEDAPVV